MRTILITGANSAIASSFIKKYGLEYDGIITHYGRRYDRIDELIGTFGERIIPIQADLSSHEEVEKLLVSVSDYEINEFLHLAAPGLRHMRFTKGKFSDFDLELQVVYWSFLRICQSIIPGMVKRNEGRILAILTEYTITFQPAYLSHYISAKYALLGLIKSLASEYASKGIRVNGISPGMIETDFISKLPQYIIDNNAKSSSRRKNLNPEDLVPTIGYLMSKESEFINGQNIMLQ